MLKIFIGFAVAMVLMIGMLAISNDLANKETQRIEAAAALAQVEGQNAVNMQYARTDAFNEKFILYSTAVNANAPALWLASLAIMAGTAGLVGYGIGSTHKRPLLISMQAQPLPLPHGKRPLFVTEFQDGQYVLVEDKNERYP